MTTRDRITSQLEPFARDGVLAITHRVELFEADRGWVAEASGSSVAWLASAADDVADFGRVRVVTCYGEVVATDYHRGQHRSQGNMAPCCAAVIR